jgi:hypothetical protein
LSGAAFSGAVVSVADLSAPDSAAGGLAEVVLDEPERPLGADGGGAGGWQPANSVTASEAAATARQQGNKVLMEINLGTKGKKPERGVFLEHPELVGKKPRVVATNTLRCPLAVLGCQESAIGGRS